MYRERRLQFGERDMDKSFRREAIALMVLAENFQVCVF